MGAVSCDLCGGQVVLGWMLWAARSICHAPSSLGEGAVRAGCQGGCRRSTDPLRWPRLPSHPSLL